MRLEEPGKVSAALLKSAAMETDKLTLPAKICVEGLFITTDTLNPESSSIARLIRSL